MNAIKQLALFAKKGVLVIACLVGFTACDQEDIVSILPFPEIESVDVLTRAIYSAHLQLDPHLVKVSADAAPVRDLFVGLMAFDTQGKIQNALAKEWFSDDGKNWLFILDEEAKWSNGQAVTSADFVASWQRLSDPKNAAPVAPYLIYMGVENSREILSGQLSPEALGIKALNPTTLQIKLDRTNYQLPMMLAHTALLPTYQGQKPASDSSLVSNGSYQIEIIEKNRLRLKARDIHTPFQFVQYQLITTAQNPERFDIVENPLDSYQRNEQRFPRLCSYFYEFNFNDPLLAQKPIRQAIRSMISPMEISKGYGVPLHLTIPKQLFNETDHLPAHINAEQHLNDQGIHPANPLKLTVAYDKYSHHLHIAERIARALGQSDLFRVHLLETNWAQLLEKREQKNFQLIRSGWCADYPDPVLFLSQFHSQSPDNKSGYHNLKIDELLLELNEKPLDMAQRQQLISAIVHILEEDVAILPLFQYQRRMSINPSIQGIDLQNASEVIYSKNLTRKNKDQ